MDIRKETVLVIRKGLQYMQTESAVVSGTIWTPCVYDAWRTRNRNKALRQAERVGGEIWLFNPVARQLRKAKIKEEEKHD